MTPRVQQWVLAGTLALAAIAPAGAQPAAPVVATIGGYSIGDYTGTLVTTGRYRPPTFPNHWIVPQVVYYHTAPQVVFVPVAPARPAVGTVQVATLTLRDGAMPGDLRVKRETVVTWVNAGERERVLVVREPGQAQTPGGASPREWRLEPKGNHSLVFRAPGTYEYSLRDDATRWARVIVEE
jgi:hypothetical protein